MMGRSGIRLSDEKGSMMIKKGAWTPEEDQKLVDHIHKHGHGSWRALPKLAGLKRCGKSCRLRWTNYLRPDIKRGNFSEEEEHTIINLHALLGNKWSTIAGHLPGRTDNEIKNFWNTHLKKKLVRMGIDPVTHRTLTTDLNNILSNLLVQPQSTLIAAAANFAINLLLNNPIWDINNNALRLINEYPPSSSQQIANNIQVLHNILLQASPSPPTASTSSATPNNNMALDDQQQLLYDLTRNINHYSSLDGFGFSDDPQNNIPTHHDDAEASRLTPISTYHYNHHNHPQPISGSKITSSSNDHDQLPQLVSASSPNTLMINPTYPCNDIDDDHHEKEISNKMMINISPNDDGISNPSSTSTTFDVWGLGGLIIDRGEATDSYWKDIMDQASSQTWPIS